MAHTVTGAPTIHRLSSALGAELLGIDLAHPLDAVVLARIRAAFQEHHLLCFREQRLTDDELTAFSLQFGPLEAFPEKDKTKGTIEVYNVANVSPEGDHLPPQTRASSSSATTPGGTRTARTGSCPRSPRSCTASRCCRRGPRAARPGSPTCSWPGRPCQTR
jgi:hypothetical protein